MNFSFARTALTLAAVAATSIVVAGTGIGGIVVVGVNTSEAPG